MIANLLTRRACLLGWPACLTGRSKARCLARAGRPLCGSPANLPRHLASGYPVARPFSVSPLPDWIEWWGA